MQRRCWGQFAAVLTTAVVAIGCSDDESSAPSSVADTEECFDGDVVVNADDFLLVLDTDAFSDPRYAVRVAGTFEGEDLLDEGVGPLGNPLDIERLVGRRVEYTSAGLRSGGQLFVFRSERDLTDTICAVGDLAGSSNVTFERAEVTG